MALIKNRHGIIVEVTDERKAYLLSENPVAKNDDGTDKLDRVTGKKIPLIKSDHEKSYKDVTKEEEKAYLKEEEEKQLEQDNLDDAKELATNAQAAAQIAAHRVASSGLNKNKGGRKTNAQKAQEAADAKLEQEKKLREAEGSKEKYDALTDEEKKEFEAMKLTVPTA